MSGFGVKSPLRRAIITRDYIFNTAEELTNFLQGKFQDHENKLNVMIPEEQHVEGNFCQFSLNIEMGAEYSTD